MKNKKIFIINLIYFTAMVGIATLFILGYLGIFKNDIISSFFIQIVTMFAVPMLMYTLLVSKNLNKTFKDAGFNKIGGKVLGISFLLGVVLYLLNTFVATGTQSIIALFGYEYLPSSTTIKLNYEFLFKEFILTAILPAFCEEFLHRGIMLFTKQKYSNPKICLITSSILFGLMHLNINQFFYAAILGFFIGYVSIISNSIFPAMIIHFSNNFLSTYFNYGKYLNLPLASLVHNIETILFSNPILFIACSAFGVILLIYLYQILCKKLVYERAKSDMQKVINELNISNIPIEEAQEKLQHINYIIKKSSIKKGFLSNESNEKHGFVENIFLISSFVLGTLITIISFIWGVI